MADFVDKDKLFCDDYNALFLLEYPTALKLIRRLIEIADECVGDQRYRRDFTYESVCDMFAKTIVDYSKMAYDNMTLGHFDVVNMIYRAIIENVVCMDIIRNDINKELWKYYVVYSYREAILKGKAGFEKERLEVLDEIYERLEIDKEFYEKRGKKKAYIDQNYGWTYKVNKDFNFAGLCNLVNKRHYDDFKFMSDYSHGTALHLKMSGGPSIDKIMGMISSIYIGIYRMVTMYCWIEAGDEFNEVSEDIEEIIYRYIEETEAIWGKKYYYNVDFCEENI